MKISFGIPLWFLLEATSITKDIKEGCMVDAESGRITQDSLGKLAEEANPNEIVSIPAWRNRPPKEISHPKSSFYYRRRENGRNYRVVQMKIMQRATIRSWLAAFVLQAVGSQLQFYLQLFEIHDVWIRAIGYPRRSILCKLSDRRRSKVQCTRTSVGLGAAGIQRLRWSGWISTQEAAVANGQPYHQAKRTSWAILRKDIFHQYSKKN